MKILTIIADRLHHEMNHWTPSLASLYSHFYEHQLKQLNDSDAEWLRTQRGYHLMVVMNAGYFLMTLRLSFHSL